MIFTTEAKTLKEINTNMKELAKVLKKKVVFGSAGYNEANAKVTNGLTTGKMVKRNCHQLQRRKAKAKVRKARIRKQEKSIFR